MLRVDDPPQAVRRVTGLVHLLPAPPQLADVPQDGPHGGRAAVGVEHRLAHHVHGAELAVAAHDAELAVDGLAVHQTVGEQRRQHRGVLLDEPGGQLVEGERAVLRAPAEEREELLGPGHLVGEQVPLGAARPAGRDAAGLRRGRLAAGSGLRAVGGGGQAGAQLAQVFVEAVHVVRGQLAQGALPAQLRVARALRVGRRLAQHGVDAASEPPGLRDERVDRAALGRLGGGTIRGQWGRHHVLRYGRAAGGDVGGAAGRLAVTTVAQ